MAMKNKIILSILGTLILFLLSSSLAVSYEKEDPELTRCIRDCWSQPHYDIGMQRRCEDRCVREHQQKGSQQQGGEGKSAEKRTRGNHYVFGRERFRYEHKTFRGFVKVLDKFHEKSRFLVGLANYTVGLLVAEPRTFVMPTHFDADCVCYVFKGRGVLTILRKGERESHEICEGDIFVTYAGSIIYMVSSDPRERLVVVKFLRSVNLPGPITHFHVAGGRNPETIYRSFSEEVLEAAFKAPINKIESVFGRQIKGMFVQASDEQIQGLSNHTKEGVRWPFGELRGAFNLLRKQATHSNRFGALYEADSEDFQHLQHLNVRVSLANITNGSMMAPFYTSRSTKVAMVVEGSGYIEIICPHFASEGQHKGSTQRYEERGSQGERYTKIRAHLSQGTVFVIPAGHPVVEVASPNQNLQTICFEIHADKNERIFLAGRNNVLRKMEKEAKELAFDMSARDVDEVLNAQREEAFLPGPGRSRQYGGEESSKPVFEYPLQDE